MSHNILKHSMVYLSGCIDYCENGGVKWRKEITPMLKELGVGVLDPTNKPCPVHKEDENFRNEIANGNVYQVNACRVLSNQTQESIAGLLTGILQRNPAQFAGYLKIPGIEITSASPETSALPETDASPETLASS